MPIRKSARLKSKRSAKAVSSTVKLLMALRLVMAAASMAVVPVLIVFLVFQRQIVKALVLAGMK